MQGIFTTTVAFTEGGGMAFAPDHHGVLEVINTNVLDGCLALASARRASSQCAPLRSTSPASRPDCTSLP